ncbi:MAG: DUF4395 domain-containing protein [Chloroflexi bacterium]|nr:DUF4395 domain-containing protein [Chloroflexota bacterium]
MAAITADERSGLRALFTFPHPVNEYAARSVAAMVFVLAVVIIVADVRWLLFVLAYGFLARVLTGPKLSPMGLLATRVIAPKLIRRSKLTAGPPKQFAQTIGLAFSVTALVLVYGFGLVGAAYGVLGVLVLFAGLEAFVGFCAGCFVFGYLMRWGFIPAETCERCNNLNFAAEARS